ncbi:AlpA family phage regulatory protein [Stenotrophomonas sp. MH1]|uniref:AlpA family phage regulatory protein n=1 Tax=Stenotrophomonas capsici TaxID=3110230 RepID=A0ABU5V7N2_9GAMM|nr:AlpA family phage regulatory protein [Stenotrophomonas sp. MH1]MEA5668070.1 AlpA family phage regulatory protein [Stenotrophomonas sp. MH1]
MNYREPYYSSNAFDPAPNTKSELWAAVPPVRDSAPVRLSKTTQGHSQRYAQASHAFGADSFLRMKAVIELSGLSRSTIYSYIKDGKVPAQCKIGERAVGWRASAVFEWISTRARGAQ